MNRGWGDPTIFIIFCSIFVVFFLENELSKMISCFSGAAQLMLLGIQIQTNFG